MSDRRLSLSAESAALDPVEAFELLAHETRLGALLVLWRHDEPMQFSEIADRVDAADTGNFNYHIGKLVGHFVRKDGEAYELTERGLTAITALLTGEVTDRPSADPVPLGHSCPYCDASLELRHDGASVHVVCSDCPGIFADESASVRAPTVLDGTLLSAEFPASGLYDRSPEAILEAATTRAASRMRDMVNGLCPDCAGPVARTATVCPDHERDCVCPACGSRFAGIVRLECETCRTTSTAILQLAGLADPRVRAYFHDHGHDVLDPSCETVRCLVSAEERVLEADPVAFEARWHLGEETLAVRFDGDASITRCRREREQ